MLKTLKSYFGYTQFRPLQQEIITCILEKRDTLVLMPTGGGKSICYQLPALMMEGTAIVVSPLISLMKDQVESLQANGIIARALNSSNDETVNANLRFECMQGRVKLLYISPERLLSELNFLLKDIRVSLFAIDEAHCISQWGYDFRPAYLKISDIRKLLPGIPVLALTATATPEVVKDIQQRLGFEKENVFRMSFERSNLAYIVRRTENKADELLHILKSVNGSAIVYTRNRKKTKEIALLLNQNDITATFYHAGLSNELKDQRQKDWVNGTCRVMVATNAFGMGIDKPDVRLVLHADFPDSPEAYFQEAGRAGRDGQKAYAVLLYAQNDKVLLKKRIADTFPEKEYIRKVYEDINYYYQMAMGDGLGCTYAFNIDEFCQNFKHFPIQVDSALKILTRAGYLEYTDEQDNASRLIFTLNRDELYRIHENNEDTEKLLRTILRSYTGLFTDYAYINEDTLALRSGLNRQQVYDTLIALSKRRILNYIPGKKTPYIVYTRERQETRRIVLSREVYEDRKESYIRRINAMLEYADAEDKCRSRMLLYYFGERNEHNCGQCDVCITRHKSHKQTEDLQEMIQKILSLLNEGPLSVHEIADRLFDQKELAMQTLSYLQAEEKVVQKSGKLFPA